MHNCTVIIFRGDNLSKQDKQLSNEQSLQSAKYMWLYSNSFLDKMVVFTLETDNPFSKSGMRSVCMGIYNGANISSYL